MHRALCVLLAVFLLGACANPRAENRPAPDPDPKEPRPRPAALSARLAPRHAVGQRYDTERLLKVREQTAGDIVVLEGIETTRSEVISADEQGQALIVRRHYEQSLTRLGSEGGRLDETRNPLHGCTLELRRDAQGTAGATLVEGKADVGRQRFLIDGFDAALLPAGEVHEGDRWNVPAEELARPGGLNSLISAQGFKIEKNELEVRVSELTERRATLDVDWRITGSFGQAPAVMTFKGSLDFDREAHLVSRFVLRGGRQAEGGHVQQITITVTRARP